MSENYNKLTEAETERLALMAEACGEIIQAIVKILRHGYGAVNGLQTNREQLQKAMGDYQAAAVLMETARDIDVDVVYGHFRSKERKLKRYLNHQ